MAINDIYEVTHVQEHEDTGERIMNKWFFVGTDTGSTAADLYNAFCQTNSYLERVHELQSRVINDVEVRVINLFSLTDFFIGDPNGQGAIADDNMLPLHDALSITLKLNTRGVRPGSKRISGIVEADQNKGIITGTAYITALNSTLAFLASPLVSEDDPTYDLVVVKRIEYTVPDSDPPRTAWRLPANAGEADYGTVIAAIANLRVSHQISRGNGR